jgi:methionyl-tRNA formyltransferase
MTARVLLITYHYMGVLYINELLSAGDEIVGVVNWPGNTGFNQGWYVPPEYDVRAKAFQHYLPLYEPDPQQLNSPEFVEVIRRLAPDFIVSGYYSKIFKKPILSIPKAGCINIHPTGLPRYRGLSPYFTHLLFGEDRNYITMHWLNPGIDTGNIIAQTSIEILPDDTGYSSGHRLTEAGAAMFREYWPAIKAGNAPSLVQDETQASVFNFSWDMAEIHWEESNLRIWNLIRCLTKPLGGSWTKIDGCKMHIWSARVIKPVDEIHRKNPKPGEILALTGKGLLVQCGEGQLEITDYSLDDHEDQRAIDLLARLEVKTPLLLGR